MVRSAEAFDTDINRALRVTADIIMEFYYLPLPYIQRRLFNLMLIYVSSHSPSHNLQVCEEQTVLCI